MYDMTWHKTMHHSHTSYIHIGIIVTGTGSHDILCQQLEQFDHRGYDLFADDSDHADPSFAMIIGSWRPDGGQMSSPEISLLGSTDGIQTEKRAMRRCLDIALSIRRI